MAYETKNRLINYILDKALFEVFSQYAHGKLLDIGCGIKPYREMLAPYVSEHVGMDHEGSIHNDAERDIVGTAYDIPSDENYFDTILCSAVLEHLEEPEQALRECFRVLKPGGYAIYSIPFIWHVHEEPRDFYRYSKYGIRYLFEKSGFSIVELIPLSGFWVTFGQLFVYNLYHLNRGPLRWFRIIDCLGLFCQGFAFFLDKLDKDERWTWMYLVVARKP